MQILCSCGQDNSRKVRNTVMSFIKSKSNQGSRKSVRIKENVEVINKDKQNGEARPELSRAISMQKIMMKSKGTAQQIEEKENEIRRYSIPQNASLSGGRLLNNRTQRARSPNPKKKQFLGRNESSKEADQKRPASVALPYISPKSPSSSLMAKNRNQQRAKSLFTSSKESEEIYKISKFNYSSSNAVDLTPQSKTETKEFQSFPVDKEERAQVENAYSSVELNPVSYTYLLMLEENPPETMKLRNHGLGAKSITVLKNTLDSNNNVKELDLEGNALNDIGVEDLGIMMRGNMHIEHLNISSNTFSSKGIIAIGHLLESNKTLQSLSLSRNKLSDTDLELLCSSLEDTDNNLKTLDLSFNSFTPDAGHTLGRFLTVSRKLEDLNIAGNNFGASGVRPVFEGLKGNYRLKRLDLAFNEISDRGMEIIAAVHSLGRRLQYLDLSDNFITVKGIKHFMPILDGNDSLSILKIDNNQIGTNGLIFVLESILEQVNDALTQLHARGVFADQTIMKLCDEIRNLNSKFVLFGVTGNSSDDTNDALTMLQIYLNNNKIIDSERSERIGMINDVEN